MGFPPATMPRLVVENYCFWMFFEIFYKELLGPPLKIYENMYRIYIDYIYISYIYIYLSAKQCIQYTVVMKECEATYRELPTRVLQWRTTMMGACLLRCCCWRRSARGWAVGVVCRVEKLKKNQWNLIWKKRRKLFHLNCTTGLFVIQACDIWKCPKKCGGNLKDTTIYINLIIYFVSSRWYSQPNKANLMFDVKHPSMIWII